MTRRVSDDRNGSSRKTKAIGRVTGATTLVMALALAGTIPSVNAANASSDVVRDSYDRTSTAGWGKADVGGAYVFGNPSKTSLTTANGAARVNGLPPGQSFSATLPSVSAADVAVQGALTVPSVPSGKFGLYHAISIRGQESGSAYRGRLEVMSGGKLFLAVSRFDRGSDVSLGKVQLPKTLGSNQKMRIEFKATGTSPVTLQGRAWADGSAVPDWQLTVKDTSTARIAKAGSIGIWQYVSGGNSKPVVSVMDDLRAAPVSAASTTPAPAPVAPAPAPAPVAPAPAPATGQANRGAAAVGSANYAIPANAIFVDVAKGADNAGGSQNAPLRTLASAVAKAKSGQTIVLRKGTYNESVSIPANKSLTIQSYPNEAVWLDGSVPVSTWKKTGSTWVSQGWTPEFSRSLDGKADNPRFVDPANPMAARPDQVFIDGAQLKQVGSAAQVSPGKFFVDYAANTITLGSDPTGRDVRASNLAQAIYSPAPNTKLQGFGVRRYATPYDARAAVVLAATSSAARNLVVVDNAMIGIAIQNNDSVAERVTVQRNGMMGIGVNAAYGLVIRDSIITNNNSEAFKPEPVSGGIKVTRSRGVTILNNDTSNNQNSTGIWLDESVYNANVSNNVSSSNGKNGIELELSDTAIVANNETVGQETGILLYNTGNVKVFNNNVGGNRLFGVKLAQDERRQAVASFAGQDPRRPAVDPTTPWLTRNITISNNVFGNGGYFQFYALDGVTKIPVDQMNVTITGNLFNKRVTTKDPTVVAWGGNDGRTLARFETPDALAAAKGKTWKNSITDSSLPLSQMAPLAAKAKSVAVPLPADVAKAMGKPAGSTVVGRF